MDITVSVWAAWKWLKLPIADQERIYARLLEEAGALQTGERRGKKLRKDPTKFTLRVGHMRVVYTLTTDGSEVLVEDFGDRSDVYESY